MNKNFMKALGYALLMLVFPVVSSIIIQIREVSKDSTAFIIQAIAFITASVIGLWRMKAMKLSIHNNIRKVSKKILWFIPLFIIEILGLLLGFQSGLPTSYILSLLIFTIAVGVSEEVFFRGIVLRILQKRNHKYAIVTSSVLFAILHLANLAGGIPFEYAILQVIFAFLFGFICAETVMITDSLFPVIIWHFAHDFISFMSGDLINGLSLIILFIQSFIMLGYAIYLWKRLEY